MIYIEYTIEKRNNKVNEIKKFLKGKKFDGFVGRGLSGITMASMLAYSMKKKLVMVRKHSTDNHSSKDVEGLDDKKTKLIIIDDFVDSGNTLREIKEKLNRKNVTLLGVILYEGENPGTMKLHGLKFLHYLKEEK